MANWAPGKSAHDHRKQSACDAPPALRIREGAEVDASRVPFPSSAAVTTITGVRHVNRLGFAGTGDALSRYCNSVNNLPHNLALAYFASEWVIRLAMLIYVPQQRTPAAARSWLLLIFVLPWPG